MYNWFSKETYSFNVIEKGFPHRVEIVLKVITPAANFFTNWIAEEQFLENHNLFRLHRSNKSAVNNSIKITRISCSKKS